MRLPRFLRQGRTSAAAGNPVSQSGLAEGPGCALAGVADLANGQFGCLPVGQRTEQTQSATASVEQNPSDRPSQPRPTVAEAPTKSKSSLPLPNLGPSGHRAWLCQKLVERGTESLGDSLADYELLEMLLFLAQPKEDTQSLAKAAINRFGSFARVLTAPTRELFALPLGLRTVAAIRLVQASAIRLVRSEIVQQSILDDWDRVIEYLNAVMAREKVEQFRVLFLDKRNRLLADEAQARGTVDHTPVYPREVIKRALELHANALILVHNHPSGDPTPSDDDIEMTRQVKAAAQMMSIVLHDHIIIGNGRWVSFRKKRLL